MAKNDERMFWALFLVASVLSLGVLGHFYSENTVKLPNIPLVSQPKADPSDRYSDLLNKYNQAMDVNAKLYAQLQRTSDKLALLGTVMNNNFLVDQKNLPRTEYVYVNSDWTIDKMPNQMNFSPEDKEFFNKYLKKVAQKTSVEEKVITKE